MLPGWLQRRPQQLDDAPRLTMSRQGSRTLLLVALLQWLQCVRPGAGGGGGGGGGGKSVGRYLEEPWRLKGEAWSTSLVLGFRLRLGKTSRTLWRVDSFTASPAPWGPADSSLMGAQGYTIGGGPSTKTWGSWRSVRILRRNSPYGFLVVRGHGRHKGGWSRASSNPRGEEVETGAEPLNDLWMLSMFWSWKVGPPKSTGKTGILLFDGDRSS